MYRLHCKWVQTILGLLDAHDGTALAIGIAQQRERQEAKSSVRQEPRRNRFVMVTTERSSKDHLFVFRALPNVDLIEAFYSRTRARHPILVRNGIACA